MDPHVLAFQFAIGAFVLEKNLADITHQDSLKAPQPGGNTMNWIVGHVVRTRNQALGLLGAKPLFDDTELNIYGAAGFRPDQAMPLEELKKRFNALGPVLAGRSESQHRGTISACRTV
jgi:hypothetical protein